MNYEKANVKEYFRKNSKGEKTPYYQIHLGNKTKFNKSDEVAIIKEDEFKSILNNNNDEYLTELENKVTESEERNKHLTEGLEKTYKAFEDLEKSYKDIISKNEEHISEINELTKLNQEQEKRIEEVNSKIIALYEDKDSNVAEIKELNYKLNQEKDFTKALLVAMNDLNKRSFFSRLFNKEPDSVKTILKLKPIEANVESNSKD